jgi:hypothetical protein
VDVLACRQVHDRVAAPVAAPQRFFHFLLDGGGQGRIPDVGIDLDQEVAADDHGLAFGVVDVGRDNGPSCSYLLAYEFRGDIIFGGQGSEAAAAMLLPQGVFVFQFVYPLVFADGDVFHLGGDASLAGIMQLGDVAAGAGTVGGAYVFKAQRGELVVAGALAAVG